jgi:hypothetical protein
MLKKNEPFLFDVRLMERNIKSGAISRKEIEKYLKNLPDITENAEKLWEEKSPAEAEGIE